MVNADIPRIEIGEGFWRQINVLETVIDVLGMRLSDFHEPLKFALKYIVLPSVEMNFARGGRPPWQPLAPSTVGRRDGQLGPILYRTGKLFNAAIDEENWTVTQDMLALTSISDKVSYAGYHQLGAPRANIPARPYVEFQPQDIEDITSLFEAWVNGIVDEVWGFGEEEPG
jgi:phage gpG-like protein